MPLEMKGPDDQKIYQKLLGKYFSKKGLNPEEMKQYHELITNRAGSNIRLKDIASQLRSNENNPPFNEQNKVTGYVK